MDTSTIVWIVIGVVVLLVIIAIIYAVTRGSSSDDRQRPVRGRPVRGVTQRRAQTTTHVETDRQVGDSRSGGIDRGVEQRPRGRGRRNRDSGEDR